MGQTELTPDPGLAPTTGTLPTQCPAFSIITVRPAPSVCHTVYRARSEPQFSGALKDLQTMSTGDIGQIVVGGRELIPLGDALFDEHSAHVFGDGQALNDIKNKWDLRGGEQVSKAAVVYRLPPEDEQSRQDQAKEIAKQVNDGVEIANTEFKVVTVQTAVTLPTGCPAFTILLPEVPVETVCMTVYRTTSAKAFNRALDTLNNLAPGANIQASVIVRNKLDPFVDSVQFEANTINVVGDSMRNLLTAWHARGGGLIQQMALVCRKQLSPDEDHGLRIQADSIRTNIGAVPGSPGLLFTPVDDSLVFPTNCRAFVILLTQGG